MSRERFETRLSSDGFKKMKIRMVQRRAFTLNELLVVFAIIGVLLSVTLPAVQAAREAARRLYCQSNIRQIGTALQSFQSARRAFPVGVSSKIGRDGLGSSYSVFTRLLAELDEVTVARSVDWSVSPLEENNREYFESASIAILKCPSDPNVNGKIVIQGTDSRAPLGHSYVASVGVLGSMQNEQKLGLLLGDKARLGGPFREDVAVLPAEIVDGLFCTAFFSERRIGTSSNSTYVPNGKPFVDVARLPTTELLVDMGNPNRLSDRCATIPLNFPTWSRTNAREWYSAVYSFYNHVLGPNANVADCGDATNVPVGVFSARSYHSSCVNTLFGDGHVEPISDSIDLEVWRSLGSRAGGESFSIE